MRAVALCQRIASITIDHRTLKAFILFELVLLWDLKLIYYGMGDIEIALIAFLPGLAFGLALHRGQT